MYAKHIKAMEDFFEVSRMLDDDIELICDFMVYILPRKTRGYKRSKIKRFIENAGYSKLGSQFNIMANLPHRKYYDFIILCDGSDEQQKEV